MSGQALADLAQTSRPHLSHIEAGRKQPSPELARRLAEALKVPLVAILAGVEK